MGIEVEAQQPENPGRRMARSENSLLMARLNPSSCTK
jgi:hypothetical protein